MKKCDLCQENDATMTVRRMDKDGNVTELEVCADCARKRGFSEAEKLKMSVAEVLAEIRSRVSADDDKVFCTSCGMSFAEFKRLGRLGCAGCYQSFEKRLEPLVRRIQGAVQHVGKASASGPGVKQPRTSAKRLREELQSAIRAEDYERAAELRDQLNRAEKADGR